MLMSASCIKKIFPNDIGSAQVIKNLVTKGKLKPVKQKKIVSNHHTLDNFKGAKKITTFYNSEDIEAAIEKSLNSPNRYRLSMETKEGYERLRHVTSELEKLEEDKAC